jgi:endogenous inhibitor of DNA gyrase (YacG/DUF329 family)
MPETKHKCPICKDASLPRAENKCFPFCSPRCKQVDLGRWLNEEYRIPIDENSTERSLVADEPEYDA